MAETELLTAADLAVRPLVGLYDVNGNFFIVAAGLVSPASRYGDAGAILLLARSFGTEELDEIVQRMAINIDFWSMNTPNLDVLEAAAGAALSLGPPTIVTRKIGRSAERDRGCAYVEQLVAA